MSELPSSWTQKRLSSVVKPRKQKAAPSSLGTLPFVGLEHVEAHSARILGHGCTSEMKSAVAVFQEGDVLYGRLRPYLNKVVRPEFSGAASAEFIVLPGNEELDARFLHRLLMQPAFVEFASHINQGDRPRVDFNQIGEFALGLPPVEEQRRIVAKLDKLFERSKSAREELARISRLVERYREAILAAAFRGSLTAEWRRAKGMPVEVEVRLEQQEPYRQLFEAPPTWSSATIESVCEIIGGSQPPKTTFVYEPQEGYVRLVQIRDYKSDERATYIPKSLARRFCSSEDVMIGRYGPPLFQILRGLEGAYNVALMKAVPREGCSNEFLFYRLQDPALRRYVEMGSDRTAGQDGVNKAHLVKYPLFLPSEEEQAVLVSRLKDRLASIDRSEKEVSRAMALLNRLDQATLAKAFRGELFYIQDGVGPLVGVSGLPLSECHS